MKFLALDLYDQDTKQAFRVSLNPRFIVTCMSFETEEEFHLKNDDLQKVNAVSITFELHNENQIDMLMEPDHARALLVAFHKADQAGGEFVFKDIRTYPEFAAYAQYETDNEE